MDYVKLNKSRHAVKFFDGTKKFNRKHNYNAELFNKTVIIDDSNETGG